MDSAYCERIGDGFWAEPFNALTNAAFVLAAWLIARYLARNRQFAPWWDVWLLVALAASIGIGSFLWHTLATPWSELADVIPIALFIAVFIGSFLVRVAGLSWPAVLALLVSYQGLNYVLQASVPADTLNGSIYYLPAWATLVAMAEYCRYRAMPQARGLVLMSAVFTLSLAFRTLDATLCDGVSVGTHFIWHLLNAWLLYRAMRVVAD